MASPKKGRRKKKKKKEGVEGGAEVDREPQEHLKVNRERQVASGMTSLRRNRLVEASQVEPPAPCPRHLVPLPGELAGNAG